MLLSPDNNTAYLIETYMVDRTQHTTTKILDVSNPESPTLLGSFDGGSNAALSPDGTKIYHGGLGLQIMDVSDPTSVVDLGSYNINGAKDIVISSDGTKVYVARDKFLYILDVSDASNPTLMSTFTVAWYYYAEKITLSPDGTKAYMSFNNGYTGDDYLYSIDVSDPTSPTFLDWRKQGNIYDISVSADGLKAYVADKNKIDIIDISDPSNLRWKKRINIPNRFHRMAISSDESRVYSGNTYGGVLSSIDISGSEGVLSSINLGSSTINDVVLSSDSSTAFVVTGSSGLQIVNLQVAPLSIKASTETNISTYINEESEQVNIKSISAQSSVSYSIESGVLPAGLTLIPTGNTTAMITGTPVELGTFNLTVKGTNADGDVASIQLQYTVEDTPPPLLSSLYFSSDDYGFQIDLNDYNTGSSVVLWSIAGCPWVNLNQTSGVLDVDAGLSCDGTIRAENEGGFDEKPISIIYDPTDGGYDPYGDYQ